MKKVLYCMHVGWNWIKQRPHYIAEELSKKYDVTVISDYNYRVKKTKILEKDTLHIKNFYKIPKLDNSVHFMKINMWLRKVYYTHYIKKIQPEYLYVMVPSAVHCIPEWYRGIIIYDCMDDMLEFTKDVEKQKQIAKDERRLIERADITLVSSSNLKCQLMKRYPHVQFSKITLVRNGYNGQISKKQSLVNERKEAYTICYFGTVAEWINFKYLEDSLKELTNIEYLFIGPLQAGTSIPKSSRIRYIGSVDHDKLLEAVEEADAFMMPFKVTPLIESVDPVKLYEYINFNKNILCVEYPEVARFEEFVYFYNNYDSFVLQIKKMMAAKDLKYSTQQRLQFLRENTWENRAQCIFKVIESLEMETI